MKGNTIMKKKYGFWNFILDVVLTAVTSGFWLIWIFIREMRKLRA